MAKRQRELEAKVAAFLRKYGRKGQRRREPNDRRFDRQIQPMIRRMKPEELDRLMRGSADRGEG